MLPTAFFCRLPATSSLCSANSGYTSEARRHLPLSGAHLRFSREEALVSGHGPGLTKPADILLRGGVTTIVVLTWSMCLPPAMGGGMLRPQCQLLSRGRGISMRPFAVPMVSISSCLVS